MKNILEAHMGDNFDKLSPLLRMAHKGNKLLHRHAEVKRGNLLAEIICTLFRFPMPAKQACLNEQELEGKYCFRVEAVSYTHLTLPTICSV